MKCHEIHQYVARLENLDVPEAHQSMGITWSLCEHVPGKAHVLSTAYDVSLDHWFGHGLVTSDCMNVANVAAFLKLATDVRQYGHPVSLKEEIDEELLQILEMFHLLDELQ